MRLLRLFLTALLVTPGLLGLLAAAKFVSAPTQAVEIVEQEETIGKPRWLIIPALGIKADIEHVGLTADGAMDVPKAWENVGWFQGGSKPGEQGNAVIAGHFDSDTGPAVFWQLQKLEPGDEIRVIDDRNRLHIFHVREKEKLADDATALDAIFGSTVGTHLNLITCGGVWNEAAQHYEERLAVFAELTNE